MVLHDVTINVPQNISLSEKVVTVLDLLSKGGIIMVPIGLLSVIAVYIIIERVWTVMNASGGKKWVKQVKEKLQRGDVIEAELLCDKHNNAISRVLLSGLTKKKLGIVVVESNMEQAAKEEVYQLEERLSLLSTIAGIAPMLGFLGTVTGMIQAFMVIAQTSEQVNPRVLANGIYEAMVTTAAGLAVGIIASLGYNYVIAKFPRITQDIESSAHILLEALKSNDHLNKK